MNRVVSKTLQALCGLVILPLLSPVSLAADDTAFVRQVGEARYVPAEQARQVATFSTPGQGLINNVDTGRLNDLLPNLPGPGHSSSEIVQRGSRNRAVVSVQGDNNATLQRQKGVGLDSSVLVAGARNAVLVDQQGTNLSSEIGVVGANKRILHIQRGRGAAPNNSPLTFTGVNQETQLVLDTPKGRLTKTLPQKR